MSLIKCKECGKEVSTLAENCPNCGAPVEKEQIQEVPPTSGQNDTEPTSPVKTEKEPKSMLGLRYVLIGSVIFIVVILLIWGGMHNAKQRKYHDLPKNEQDLIGKWNLQKTRLESTGSTKVNKEDSVYQDTDAVMKLTFNMDKTGKISTSEKDTDFTWDVDDHGFITIKADESFYKKLDFEFTISHNQVEAKAKLDKNTYVWFLFEKDYSDDDEDS